MTSWRERVSAFLRVPPHPAPPQGTPPRVFRAAVNFYRLRLFQRIATQVVLLPFAISMSAAALFVAGSDQKTPLVIVVTLAAFVLWVILIADVVIGYAIVRLDYEMRWYMVSDRAIRIREGIIVVNERTVTLANIQNISVRQGPIQRLLGIADVEVRTAGGSDSTGAKGEGRGAEPLHVCYFRGVDNAPEIRDLLAAQARRFTGTGLGDPDDQEARPAGGDALEAANALLDEVRRLRSVVSSSTRS